MKHLRHLFLAFLLMFVSAAAMAQTRNENTEKNTTEWAARADVNGDGVVNEADIAEILAIMKQNSKQKYYWYVGQEAITANNYTTLAEYSSTEYTTKNYTTEKRGSVYILVPDDVQSIAIKDKNGFYMSENAFSLDASVSIPNYKVYKTNTQAIGATIIVEFIR